LSGECCGKRGADSWERCLRAIADRLEKDATVRRDGAF
jgi:hypothetical protein